MNNNLAEILFVKEKILANPQQVLFALFSQGNARPYPRVDEKEITTCERRFQIANELAVAFWQCLIKSGSELGLRRRIRVDRWCYPIRHQCLEAPIVLPVAKNRRIGQKVGQIPLVVAFEKDRPK